jgi:hypothetical protein
MLPAIVSTLENDSHLEEGSHWCILFISMLVVLVTGVALGIFASFPGSRKHTEKELDDIIRKLEPRRNDHPKIRRHLTQIQNRAYKEKQIQGSPSCCGYINPIFIVVIISACLYS